MLFHHVSKAARRNSAVSSDPLEKPPKNNKLNHQPIENGIKRPIHFRNSYLALKIRDLQIPVGFNHFPYCISDFQTNPFSESTRTSFHGAWQALQRLLSNGRRTARHRPGHTQRALGDACEIRQGRLQWSHT